MNVEDLAFRLDLVTERFNHSKIMVLSSVALVREHEGNCRKEPLVGFWKASYWICIDWRASRAAAAC